MANTFDQFDESPVSGNTFDQFDKAPEKTSAVRKLGDLGLGFASGAVGATKAITDAAGAGNKASTTLASLNTGINDYLSPEAKADQQEQSRILAESSGQGVWEGIKSGVKAFGVAPVQTAVQGLGSIVPILAGTALTGGAAPAAAVGAGIGAAMGTGTAKGAIYDEIKKRGGTEEEATRAQEYGGANTDQIALGGVLGTADALTGVSKMAGNMVRGALKKPVTELATQTVGKAAERGIIGRSAMGMLSEMPLEAAQGGQEQVAANIAAQRAGYEAGTWDNVASNATLEAMASAGPGAAFGAMGKGPASQPPAGTDAPPTDPVQGIAPETGTTPGDIGGSVGDAAGGIPAKPSEAMGIKADAGPLSRVAAGAVDGGVYDEIQQTQATEQDQAAYDAYMAQQEAEAQQQDTANQAITQGPLAEAQMSEEDKRAVLFSNAAVADGGRKYEGTQNGDILNGMGEPFATRFAAARRAKMEGAGWTIAPVFDGFVARRKDAFKETGNGTTERVLSAPTDGGGQDGPMPQGGVGNGADAIGGQAAEQAGTEPSGLGESGEYASEVPASPVAQSNPQPVTLGKQVTASAGPGFTAKDVVRVQDPAPATNEPTGAQATPDAQAQAVGANTDAAEPATGAGSAQVEANGVSPLVSREQAVATATDVAQAVLDSGGTDADANRAATDSLIEQMAQSPGIEIAQDAPAAVKAAKSKKTPGPASPGSVKADMDHLFGVDAKRTKALDRIAKGTAYFGTNLKAAKFIADNGLKDTHEWVKTGASRFEVREKATTQEALQVPSERETRIASALANGGHVVGADLRDRTGMRLMGLTPEELKTIPADKVRAKPSAEAARTNSTTKGNEDGTQTAQAQPQQTQPEAGADTGVSEPATGAGVAGPTEAVEKPSLRKAQAKRVADKQEEAPTVESVAKAIQQKVASNRRKYREKSRKEREAKGYAPNSTPESEQTDYDAEIGGQPSEMHQRSAAALIGSDPRPLIEMFVNGNFEASEDVFKDITGVKIRGLSAVDKKAALYKWANWTPEQIAKAEADAKDRSDRAAEKNKQENAKTRVMGEWAALINLNIGEPGTKGIDGQEFVLQAVAKGYDKAHSQKKGIATIYGLTNGKEFTTLKKGAFTDFVKAAIAFGGLDKTLEYVNPPKPQAPAGFKDSSIETGKDAGMIAKAFVQPTAETSEQKQPVAPVDIAPVATETVAKPDAKAALSEREKAAKAKMLGALGKLAALASKNTRMNWTQEEEQALLPIVIELFDGAMELGYVTFQQAVQHVREFIANGIDQETADAIPFETLQGAYIAVAGRHKDKPVTSKKEVVSFDSLEELGAPEPTPEDTVVSADATAKAKPEATSTQKSLAQSLAAEILNGKMPKDNPALKKLVEAFDGKPADQARMKEAQEALEAAIVSVSRDVVSKNEGPRSTFDALLRLYESQPNLNIRTSTSIANQAYSTPAPLAYLGSVLADVTPKTTLYEPTAGNGMLTINAKPANVTVNELEAGRIGSLKAQGFKEVLEGDAVKADVPPKSQDRVMTNPPFGSIKDAKGEATKILVDGYRIGQIDHLIAARALETMKDDGKATLIIGANKVSGGLNTDDRIFFNWLYGNYNVTSHFEVEGDLYMRQGAGWPVRVITINGRLKSDRVSPVAGTIQRAQNWEQVYEHFTANLDASRAATGNGAIQSPGGAGTLQANKGTVPEPSGKPVATDGVRGQVGSTVGNGNVSGPIAGTVSDGVKRTDALLGGGVGEQRLNAESVESDRLDPAGDAIVTAPAKPAGSAGATALSSAENQFQVTYEPRSSRKDGGVLIPVNMKDPTQDALSRLEDAVGDIDDYAAKELGYDSVEQLHGALMGLQVDSVASAIYQINQGKGVVIADQTGIGKGRQAAAVIRWAERSGYIPVFVSVKPSLFTDMFGDLHDIGSDNIAPFILNKDESIKGPGDTKLFANRAIGHKQTMERIRDTAQLPTGSNAIFMTYSQVNTDNVQRQMLTALADRAVFILDESHNAGGQSNTGEFITSLLEGAKGVTYLSATYAKRPDNMPLYFKTDIGQAAADNEGLMQAMASGGLPLQTVVSNNLVKAGQMFRRERSYDGVSIETIADTKHRVEHEALSDTTTKALRAIVAADSMFHHVFAKQMNKDMQKLGGAVIDNAGNQAQAGVDHTQFSSVVHNFVKQMLLGLKAQRAADDAIAALKRGEKPIIAVENTMGSFLEAYAKDNNVLQGGTLGSFDYRTVLSRALARTLFINEVKPNGEKVKREIKLSQLDPETRAAYDAAQSVIDGLKLEIPVSPIDWIRNEIRKAGFTIAEITGRKLAVDYSTPGKAFLGAIDQLEQTDKVRTTQLFNSGRLDALVLNVAGSTGISLHASEKFEDQRPRHMIVAQAAGDINIFMQMLGRIHRTGQVVLPRYSILVVDLPTEKRPTAVLSGKMKSLNANTSSNTDSATSIKTVDMFNKYGDQVVAEYLQDNYALARALDVEDLIGGEGAAEDLARKATGRLALQPIAVQNAFYEDVEAQYSATMEFLNKTNQNDLEPRTFDYDAQETRQDVLFEGPNKDSPFGEDAIYGEYSIKAQGKAMTPAEIKEAMDANLGGQSAAVHMKEMLTPLVQQFDKYIATLEGPARDSAQAARSTGQAFMMQHSIGSTFRVDINGDSFNAVVTNIRNTHKANGNPFSLSKIQVTIALNGALRSISVPATQFQKIEVSQIGRGYTVEQLFKEQPANQRETAKIVTGNLLAAYGELQGVRGTIITFTKQDGTTEQGILLPKAFDFKSNTRGDYRLPTGADALKFLQKSENKDIGRFGIQSRDGVVRVLPAGNGVAVLVPKSKLKGGKYFLDKGLIDVLGDFVTSGSAMKATTYDSADAVKALDLLMKKNALYAIPSMAEEAKALTGGEISAFSRPTFSRGAQSQANESVERLATGIASHWENAPKVVVAFDMNDPLIPESVRKEDQRQRSGGATGTPEGFYYKGTVYLMSSKLGTPNDIARVLFHEALGHYGLRGTFGKALRPILRDVAMLRRAEVDAKIKQYGLKMGSQLDRFTAAEEVLAELAQTKPELGFVQRAIAAIRTWLRQNVPGFNNMRLSDNELIQNYILPARAWVERGGPGGGGGGLPAMSRADQTDTPAFRKWFGDSKVVGAGGKPLVVYHGTPNNFNVFLGRHRNSAQFSAEIGATWFTPDEAMARGYSGGKEPMAVYLSMQNPYIHDADGGFWMFENDRAIKAARAGGHDGVIIKNVSDTSAGQSDRLITTYVTFSPTQIKSAIGNNGDFDAENPDIRFSRSLGDTLASATNSVRDVALPAGYKVNDLIGSVPGKLNWWHKTVGTQYNLAQRSPAFKRVFDGVQNFINDVSHFATEAADLAPTILPKLESWKDITRAAMSPEDAKALSRPVFEGTLLWGRDTSGKPVKMEVLEAEAAKVSTADKAQILIRKNLVSNQVMTMWRGMQLDQYNALIEGKYEREMLRPGVVWKESELKSIFNLTGEKQSDGTWSGQIGLYKEFRKATNKSLTNLAITDMLRYAGKDAAPIRDVVQSSKTAMEAAETLRDYLLSLTDDDSARSTILINTANTIIDKGTRAQDLIDRGYAPLSRFGQHTLDVLDANGERVYFGMFESTMDAAKMARDMTALHPGATVKRGTVSQEEYKLFAGVSPETLELFGDMLGLESNGDDAAAKAFQTYIKLAKNNRSSMKRLMTRKGIAGFSEDAGRVLAGFVYSNARQSSKNLHMGEMTEAASVVGQNPDGSKNGEGELKDAAVQLVDYIQNPMEEAQAVRGLMFAQYIGGSVASAMVNLTQPITMTFPWLSQYGGGVKAAKQMTAAMQDALKARTGDAKLDAAIKRAEEDGTVSPQEVHQLMQQSQGKGALRSGDGTRTGNALAAAQNGVARVGLAWGKLFGVAEQFNRRVTFIAAFRTAVAEGMADPDGFARKAISETQGIYNKGNKPKWARGAIGATLFTFKQFSVGYVEMLSRMAKNGPEGKKAAALALGVLFLMAGAGGMPGADDLDDIISGVLQSLGYNFDSKAKRKAFFVELFGEGGARFMESGVSGLPGVPIDVSGRMGLGNLIPGTGLFTKKTDHTRDVTELLGPVGDLAKRGFEAAGQVLRGDVAAAVNTVSPVAVRNLSKAYDMASMGMYRDQSGKKVIDTDTGDAIAKAIGFQPNDVKRVQDAGQEAVRMIGLNKMRESEIADEWAKGLFEKDTAKVRAARADLAEWNATNPESPIRIKFSQVLGRVKQMNMTKEQRIAKTAPAEIRAAVRQELAAQ